MKKTIATIVLTVSVFFLLMGVGTILKGDIENAKEALIMAAFMVFFLSIIFLVKWPAFGKKYNGVAGIILLMFITSFVHASGNPGDPTTGVFGCGCSASSSKTKIIELTLNPDATFNYIDNSDPDHKLLLNGTWKTKGNKVVLTAPGYEKSFHKKWKYSKNGQCIKSRHMLNFRRICLITPC